MTTLNTNRAAGMLSGALSLAFAMTCVTPRHPYEHDGAARVTRVEVNEAGFRPSTIEVRHGDRLTIELLRTSDATCATKVAFPEQGIERDLPLRTPVDIEITTDRARLVGFQCGMGMYRGSVVIR